VNLRPHFTTDAPHSLTPLAGGLMLVIASFQTGLVVLPAIVAKYCGRPPPKRSDWPKSGGQRACDFLSSPTLVSYPQQIFAQFF
jgi:hypothetical protein